MHFAQGAQQERCGSIFQQVSAGARAQRLLHILLIFMHGQIDDAGAGAVFFDQTAGFERRHAGHADIEQHQVGPVLQHQLERFGGIARFSHHGKVGSVLEQAAHAIAQHLVIVGDHATNAPGSFRDETVQPSWSTWRNPRTLRRSGATRLKARVLGILPYKGSHYCTRTCHIFRQNELARIPEAGNRP